MLDAKAQSFDQMQVLIDLNLGSWTQKGSCSSRSLREGSFSASVPKSVYDNLRIIINRSASTDIYKSTLVRNLLISLARCNAYKESHWHPWGALDCNATNLHLRVTHHRSWYHWLVTCCRPTKITKHDLQQLKFPCKQPFLHHCRIRGILRAIALLLGYWSLAFWGNR